MAFVTRSDRKFFPAQKKATGRDVGPGSYIKSEMDLGVGMKYSVAPFCSTSRRVFSNKDARRDFHTPGPGSYHHEGVKSAFKNAEKYSGGKAFQSSSNFDSGTKRFRGKSFSAEVPGPGAYESNYSSLNVKKRKYPTRRESGPKRSRVEYVKVFSTPSIPSSKSNQFGADKKPSPGPGSYTVSKSLDLPNGGKSSVFRSNTKRNIYGAMNVKTRVDERTPGPGSYHSNDMKDLRNLNLSDEPVNDHTQNSSFFASQSNRFDSFLGSEGRNEERPGPGNYLSLSHGSSFKRSKNKKIPERFQNFGTSSLRFKQQKSNLPGPGHFFRDDDVSSFSIGGKKRSPTHLLHPHRPPVSSGYVAPFLSTEQRFGATRKQKENLARTNDLLPLPPGKNPAGNNPRKKKPGRKPSNNTFLSSAPRFRHTKRAKSVPGVGTYEIRDNFMSRISFSRNNGNLKRKKKKMPRIKFGTLGNKQKAKNIWGGQRDGQKERDGPGPGSYNLDRYSGFIKKTPGRGRGRGRGIDGPDRFSYVGDKSGMTPGPGAYGTANSSFEKKNFRVRRNPTVRKKRWSVKSKMENPGPGNYDVLDEWDKKSFNVSIL